MKNKTIPISIVGAGPVGALLSIYLAKQGHVVEVFEKREDPRKTLRAEGRSINIALSHRGLRALKEIGLEDRVKTIAIPMKGRMIHNEDQSLSFQPYGEEGQMINSVSRNELNKLLIDEAENKHGVIFHFNTHCDGINHDHHEIFFSTANEKFNIKSEIIIGADGAFSEVRKSFSNFSNFQEAKENLSHGYKELHLFPNKDGSHVMEKNALHIWPRGKFMLIALPNNNGSFTCTLFLPQEGPNSFSELNSKEVVIPFFEKYFKDLTSLMPNYIEDYFSNPESSLITLQCFPWYYDNTLLIGDAAHAITPFYGQGMNAGFEDCRIFNELIQREKGNWKTTFVEFQNVRKVNGDAIAKLALQNFIEMRDLVGDPKFLLRKKIEAVIHKNIPPYLPLYTMVTFSDISYSEAYQKGLEHDKMMEEVMKINGIESSYYTKEGWEKIENVINRYLK
jgi:kynurenine 3-monooxygenase